MAVLSDCWPEGYPRLRKRSVEGPYDAPNFKNLLDVIAAYSIADRLNRDKGLNARRALNAWLKIVEDYSHCGITEETDRLITLSGLPRPVGAMLGPDDQYLAGLWSSHLWMALCW